MWGQFRMTGQAVDVYHIKRIFWTPALRSRRSAGLSKLPLEELAQQEGCLALSLVMVVVQREEEEESYAWDGILLYFCCLCVASH